MKKLKFRRLPVTIDGNVIGMLTLKDILRIEPSLFSGMHDIERIKEESEKLKRLKSGRFEKEGPCEECGRFNILYRVDGRLICDECKEAM
jgi:hypothetical protein